MKDWNKEATLAYIAERIIETDTGCHEWQGSRTKDGYGQLSNDSIYQRWGIKGVHRLVVHLVHGHEFTSRHEQVMHECHNRCCVNPAHLEVGTSKQNQLAASARGAWDAYCGENSPKAKLTNDLVREIKTMMAWGWKNNYIEQKLGLGEKMKNPRACLSAIRHGKVWRNVTI